jgi:PHP family Zn ribbon phosphoesterase
MKAAVDLHIHSALSPCADDDMTPNNIVNMARLKGLDAIAITDHNSCDNVEAAMAAAANTAAAGGYALSRPRSILVVPGMEVQTREEIHLLCYFTGLDDLYRFDEMVRAHMKPIANVPDIFGRQLIFNEKDEITGERSESLITSLTFSLEEAVDAALSCSGAVVPAHINRPSFSIISQLGFLPPNFHFRTFEFSQEYPIDMKQYAGYKMITSSDAHYLGDILERNVYIYLENMSLNDIYGHLML